VSPVRYELGFYIPEDGVLHSHGPEDLKSYKNLCLQLHMKLKQKDNSVPLDVNIMSIRALYVST
jgi:hypothetical protein